MWIEMTGKGYGDGTKIGLTNNNLTRFEATVFKSVLERMAPFAGNKRRYNSPNTYIEIRR